MGYISIDVDLDEVFCEILDCTLVSEVKRRGYFVCKYPKRPQKTDGSHTLPEFFDKNQLHDHLIDICGLQSFVSNEIILNELKNLLQ